MEERFLVCRRCFRRDPLDQTLRFAEDAPGFDQPGHRVRGNVVENRLQSTLVQIRRQEFDAGKKQSILDRFLQLASLFANHPQFAAPHSNLGDQPCVAQGGRRHVARPNNGRLLDLAE